MKTKREEWLDHAKGIACFLVVLCHVLRGLINAGIIIRTSFLGKLDFIIYLFHMPLFFMVSGYFYKKNTEIKSVREYMIFVKKKIINLGVPYGIFSIIYIFLNMITSNTNQSLNWFNLINIYKIPVAHFWFLYTLLVIFIIIPILEKTLKKEETILIVLVIIKIILSVLNIPIFFISSFAEYAFYFYLGFYLINLIKNGKVFKRKIYKVVLILVFITISLVLYEYQEVINKSIFSILKILMAIYGAYVTLMLLVGIKNYKILNILGQFSFQIYIMHTIFAAAIRVLLLKIGVMNGFIHFAFGMSAGVGAPIIAAMISNKIIITNLVIYPLRTIKELNSKRNY